MSQQPTDYDDIAQYNVWTVDIPNPVKRMEKLPEDSKLLITILQGKAEAFIITDTTAKEEMVEQWLEENREFMKEMAKLGD